MRDLLPNEAVRRRRLARRVLDHFALHGYDLVTPPAFELAEVLERGLGTLDPRDVLRFVEPESGEVAALRPDMTPQIARMAATRLSDRPPPMRLCYEGTVLRRRQERARKHRQIPQAGVELLGVRGPEGDLELMCLAASSARAAGLERFVLDFGHAEIARAMIADLAPALGAAVLDALAHKDSGVLADLVRGADAPLAVKNALVQLPALHGDRSVWKEAQALLGSTSAAPALAAMRDLWDRAVAEGLESVLRVDFGEVRGFAYYTGPLFHLLADGPGEALASGGRYDDLLARFGAPMPAAGFALDLDNLAWALRVGGEEDALEPRALVVLGPRSRALCTALRAAGVSCAEAPSNGAVPPLGAAGYASAWGYSHVIRQAAGSQDGEATSLELVDLSSGSVTRVSGASDEETASRLAPGLRSR
jgi:ATP phosphoribosyltransferase regulatory subunit